METLAGTWEGKALVTRRRVGQGSAILFGSNYYHRFSDQFVRELLSGALAKARIMEFAPFSDWLEYSIQEKNGSYILCVFNHGRLKIPARRGRDFGPWKGQVRIHLARLGLTNQELDLFRVDSDRNFDMVPIDCVMENGDLIFHAKIDDWAEFVLGPKDKAGTAFFGKRQEPQLSP